MSPIARVLLLSTLTGCLSASSSDLSTSDIAAEMTVQADGETTHVFAALRDGGPDSHTYVQVSDEDTLSIDDGFRPLVLQENNLAGYIYYTQDVTAQDAGTLFTFIFERAQDEGAPASTVALPEPFELTPFEEDAVVSRTQDPFVLSWSPASPSVPMHIHLSGSCIEQTEVTLQLDEGGYVFQPGQILSLDGTAEESCKLNVTLTREREGVSDARWAAGSSIMASHVRTQSMILDP